MGWDNTDPQLSQRFDQISPVHVIFVRADLGWVVGLVTVVLGSVNTEIFFFKNPISNRRDFFEVLQSKNPTRDFRYKPSLSFYSPSPRAKIISSHNYFQSSLVSDIFIFRRNYFQT